MILSILRACLLVLLAVWTFQVLAAFVLLLWHGVVQAKRAVIVRVRSHGWSGCGTVVEERV
jgi:hypothetical protein